MAEGGTMRILVAEDQQALAEMTVYWLQKEGWQADWAKDGAEALARCDETQYDMVLLDRMMPKLSGMDVCRTLRKEGYKAAVIMVTALDSTKDLVGGLDGGADDYITKPFEFEELAARIRAVARRMGISDEDVVTAGALTLNVRERTVTTEEGTVSLTKQEAQLLELLMRHEGQTLEREQLAGRLWEDPFDVTDNALGAVVKRLRKKLGSRSEWIRTVPGLGYRFERDRS